MVKNYLKTAFRSLAKHKAFSFINVFGLSLGIAMATLLGRFIQVELSYDQFYADKARIFRVYQESEINGRNRTGITGSGLLAPELENLFPQVEVAGRTHRVGSAVLQHDGQQWIENSLAFADDGFLNIMEVEFVEGNANNALSTPGSLVLSETLAEKIFGKTTDIVGRSLEVNNKLKQVTGIIRNMPDNSHYAPRAGFLSNTAMSSFSWNRVGHVTYVKLVPEVAPDALSPGLEQLVTDNVLPVLPEGSSVKIGLYPINEIWLSEDPGQEAGGSRSALYAFSLIALFMVLLAAINYINLSTARAMRRAKEIGMRKVIGAKRSHVIWQFQTESMLIALASTLLGGFLAEMCTGLFNQLTGKTVEIGFLQNQPLFFMLIAFGLLLGFLAGIYPAFYLSTFKPIRVLKTAATGSRGNHYLRRVLVAFQFIISIGLIASTLVVYQQLNYISQKDLGYNAEQVLAIRLARSDTSEVMKQALLGLPEVSGVTATNLLPATGDSGATFLIKDSQGEEHRDIVSMASIDYDYLETMELDLLTGRNFSREFSTDESAILINETMAQKYGWEDPLGQSISMNIGEGEPQKFTVIGMVEDFNMLSLYEPVKPFALFLKPQFDWGAQYLFAKVGTSEVKSTLGSIEALYGSIEKKRPFNSIFIDDYFERVYAAETKKAQVYLTFSLLTIVIACIGLFGLATFVLQQRTREISIRKVLGASFRDIIQLVSREFVITIVIASLIASPLAYYFVQDWLNSFEYRTQIGVYIFILAGLSALLVAVAVIAAQSLRTARTNPAETLKYE